VVASLTTTAGGGYSFTNLTPGDYVIIERDLAGYVSTTPNSLPVSLTAGGSATANFGDYRLSNSSLSSIAGIVFNDANGNGIQDGGEAPLSGVTLQLRNSTGIVVATTTTSPSGAYSFANLSAGTYTVTEIDPTGYRSTTLNTVAVNLSAGIPATIHFGDQITGAAQIADPAVTKYGSPASASVGSAVVYTITVGNNGNANGSNVIVTDTKPAFLDLLSITISPNPSLTPIIAGNTFTINFGTVTPADVYVITVVTRVNAQGQPPGGANQVALTTTSRTDRIFNNAASASLQITAARNVGGSSQLPETGFAPGLLTDLRHVVREMYSNTGEITLEIPSLAVRIPVVGVPLRDGTWNVAWLGKEAGWLEGTAFPSWNGNSVLTSHVYQSSGLPGPFVNLNKLKYGDQIIVYAYGWKYTFAVQTNKVVEPTDISALKHEEKPWLTLITCKEYDETTDTYRKRVVVRAALIDAASE
jgi:LPXTG-site transpeptidase (sortase) family protein